MDLYYLFNVSTTSPGYIPRSNLNKEDFLNNPKVVVIKGNEIELKFCDTCKNIRGPRSFHCNICGVCVEKHGKTNYTFYI